MGASLEEPAPRGIQGHSGHNLTAREREVAALVAAGLTNIEIGERLFISPGTVKRHVATVMLKLGVTRRSQIAVWAAQNGLLPQTRTPTSGR
jgi:DNA-binding CsgD family transcriptional regulator